MTVRPPHNLSYEEVLYIKLITAGHNTGPILTVLEIVQIIAVMTIIIFIVSAFIITLAVTIILLTATVVKKASKKKGKAPQKNRVTALREASKKLAHNPNDIEALRTVGDIYYEEQNWEKSYAAYSPLIDRIRSLNPSDQFTVGTRGGISALKTQRLAEAKKALLYAQTINPNHFDVNYNLGVMFYNQKEYEKALSFLRKALITQPENISALQYSGLTMQHLRKYSDALKSLKKVLRVQPENKDVFFAMGECFYEMGSNEQALKIFTQLRVSAETGARASLYAGRIHLRADKLEKAIEDFEIGLKHENTPLDIANELRYHLANACIKVQDLQKALTQLKEIQKKSPSYKDVASLIQRYQELNKNKNLHIYLIAGQSEFVGLCRKIVSKFFSHSKIKIVDISVLATHTDIVAEIDTPKWSDLVIFRFFRSQASVGELLLRDFHERLKEMKAGRGICMTAGMFTAEARSFCDGRPLDLFDKKRLQEVLNSIS